MNEDPLTITGPFGRLVRRENGVIYYYKRDDLVTDYATAVLVLEAIAQLDDSGQACVIVIQGLPTSYTYDAQQILSKATCMRKAALVARNSTQFSTGTVLKSVAKAHKAVFEVEVFNSVAEAEAWIMG